MTPSALKAPKRKNTSAKGRQREAMACAILKARGYAVATAGKEVMRLRTGAVLSKQHDLFGCIDLVAVKHGEPVLFVQVGTKEMMRKKERDCLAFARDQSPDEHSDVEVWGFIAGRRPKGQRFRVTRWVTDEWAECHDAIAEVLP